MEAVATIDVATTVLVVLGLVGALAAVLFAWQFARAIGGELGAAFRFVMIGTIVFAVTRVDDILKVTGLFARMGIDYSKVVWLPHHLAVFVAWALIAFGFYKMTQTFRA